MTQLSYLSSTDQAIVAAKLAEFQRQSGNFWHCELTQEQRGNHGFLLEVNINGRYVRPVCLASDVTANRICTELDRLYQGLS